MEDIEDIDFSRKFEYINFNKYHSHFNIRYTDDNSVHTIRSLWYNQPIDSEIERTEYHIKSTSKFLALLNKSTCGKTKAQHDIAVRDQQYVMDSSEKYLTALLKMKADGVNSTKEARYLYFYQQQMRRL